MENKKRDSQDKSYPFSNRKKAAKMHRKYDFIVVFIPDI